MIINLEWQNGNHINHQYIKAVNEKRSVLISDSETGKDILVYIHQNHEKKYKRVKQVKTSELEINQKVLRNGQYNKLEYCLIAVDDFCNLDCRYILYEDMIRKLSKSFIDELMYSDVIMIDRLIETHNPAVLHLFKQLQSKQLIISTHVNEFQFVRNSFYNQFFEIAINQKKVG